MVQIAPIGMLSRSRVKEWKRSRSPSDAKRDGDRDSCCRRAGRQAIASSAMKIWIQRTDFGFSSREVDIKDNPYSARQIRIGLMLGQALRGRDL